MAALIRLHLGEEHNQEINKVLIGLYNNRRDVFLELSETTATRQKRAFRRIFGEQGDGLRYQGHGAANIGPATAAVIQNSMIKLGKALYYKHVGRPLQGKMRVKHLSALLDGFDAIEKFAQLLPDVVPTGRARQDLTDQFVYRIAIDPVQGALSTIVQFNPQLIFVLLAVSDETLNRMPQFLEQNGGQQDEIIDCRLSQPMG